MDFFKTDKEMKIVGIVLALMILGGFIHFLANDDGGMTGFEVLKRAGTGFWVGVLVAGVVIFGLVKFMLRNQKRTQDSTNLIPFLIAIGVVMAVAFGKGCTDKANGGVTTSQGR